MACLPLYVLQRPAPFRVAAQNRSQRLPSLDLPVLLAAETVERVALLVKLTKTESADPLAAHVHV